MQGTEAYFNVKDKKSSSFVVDPVKAKARNDKLREVKFCRCWSHVYFVCVFFIVCVSASVNQKVLAWVWLHTGNIFIFDFTETSSKTHLAVKSTKILIEHVILKLLMSEYCWCTVRSNKTYSRSWYQKVNICICCVSLSKYLFDNVDAFI